MKEVATSNEAKIIDNPNKQEEGKEGLNFKGWRETSETSILIRELAFIYKSLEATSTRWLKVENTYRSELHKSKARY